MKREADSRSAVSVGLEWGTRATSIGMEFAVPAVLGFGLDRWLGTRPWLTVAGALLGLTIGMMHILRLPGELARAEGRRRPGPDQEAEQANG